MSQTPDRNTGERLEEARFRVSKILALADVLEAPIGFEEVREAALVSLSPAVASFAAWSLNMAQANIKAVVLVLAGQVPDAVLARIELVDSPKALPARRPRRSRPTAADRRAAASRRSSSSSTGSSRVCSRTNACTPSPPTTWAAS